MEGGRGGVCAGFRPRPRQAIFWITWTIFIAEFSPCAALRTKQRPPISEGPVSNWRRYAGRPVPDDRVRREVSNRSLYECDFAEWCDTNAMLVREHRFAEADTERIAEELEGLGRGEQHNLGTHV